MMAANKGTLKKESGVSIMSRKYKSGEADIYTVFAVCLVLLVVFLVVVVSVAIGKDTYINNHFYGDDFVNHAFLVE